MASNRQKAKERQARRKAEQKKGNGDKDAPRRRRGGDPIADDVADPPLTPPLSESERLRTGDASGGQPEPEPGFPDIENDPEHFDPAEDQPEDAEDLTPGPRGRRGGRSEDHGDGSRVIQFLRSVIAELRRVQWPDRQALTTLTGVVLGFVIIAGSYLGLLDAIFQRLVNALI